MLSARNTTYNQMNTTASTMGNYIPQPDWSQLTQKDIEKEFEQKKKDNKLHIEVRRKDLFR